MNFVIVGVLQREKDIGFLHVPHRRTHTKTDRIAGLGLLCGGFSGIKPEEQVLGLKYSLPAQDHRALDYVSQLPDVPGPIVALEIFQRLWMNVRHLAALSLIDLFDDG